MGTWATVLASGGGLRGGFPGRARLAVRKALNEIRRLERLMSLFDPRSDVSRISSSAGKSPVKVSKETAEVLERAVLVSEMSHGAFDVTAGSLSSLWRDCIAAKSLPDPEAIQMARKTVGWERLQVDRASSSTYLDLYGGSIDLGGIAKGYAADRAVAVLRELGIASGLINIGGNVAAHGGKEDGTPWRVGIQSPAGCRVEQGEILGALDVFDKAVVTSGDYEQSFDCGGESYHHIIDPRTGYPGKSGLRSVTIVADTGLVADALSTAAFILGLQRGAELVKRAGVGAVFVDCDGDVHLTSGLHKCFISGAALALHDI